MHHNKRSLRGGMESAKSSSEGATTHVWAETRHIVFVGIRITWRRSIADIKHNTQLAEEWESGFSESTIDDRTIRLVSKTDAYRMVLSDGAGAFDVESQAAYDRAVRDSQRLIASLEEQQRELQTLYLQVEYVVPYSGSFEDLVKKLEPILLNPQVARTIGADLYDLAFLADFIKGGTHFQVHAGPVQADEIPARVQAKNLKNVPDVGIFCGVSGWLRLKAGRRGFGGFAETLFGVGRKFLRSIEE
jgi:hypothetical protein